MGCEIKMSLGRAVTTKFCAPTKTLGARVKAFAYGSTLWVDWNDNESVEENHNRAAAAFINEKQWGGVWVCGSSSDSTGYHYVDID